MPRGTTIQNWSAGEGAPTVCSTTGPADPPTSVTLGYGSDRATSVSVEGRTASATCLTATSPVLLDTVAPTASARLVAYTGKDAQVVVGWGTASDGPVPSFAGRFRVVVRRQSDGAMVWSGWRGRAGYQRITLPRGAAYRTEVKETDRAGNTGDWAYSDYLAVPIDDSAMSYHGRWSPVSSSRAYGGHVHTASARWSSATVSFTGSSVSVLARTTPDSGRVWVAVDGHYVRTIDLYSASSAWRQLVVAWQGTNGQHTLKLTVAGARSAQSTGTNVWLDGVAAG
jgi:hypothetical protein